MNAMPPFPDPAIAAAFDALPPAARAGALTLRALIYQIAAETPAVGALEETLKWGQPAYLTPETKSGSTLRLGAPKTGGFAIYAHCQMTIISDFRAQFGQDFAFDGNRAVLFAEDETPPEAPMAMLIRSALTYRLRRKASAA